MTTINARAARALLALALALVLPHSLADYDTGLAAYNRGEWEASAKELKPAADEGHAQAQFLMGTLFASGSGVEASMAEALRYYRLAADQNNGEAQAALGFTYRVGNGVPKSYEEAARWYRMAAERGVADAQFNIGSMCAAGSGVPQDRVQAFKWFSLAAAHGIEEAVPALYVAMTSLTEEQITEAQRLASEWKPEE